MHPRTRAAHAQANGDIEVLAEARRSLENLQFQFLGQKKQTTSTYMILFVVIFLVFISSEALSTFDAKNLRDWHRKISDQSSNCQFSGHTNLELIDHGLQILKVVDCDDPLAIYSYDFKVLKVSYFQNVLLLSSFGPNNQRNHLRITSLASKTRSNQKSSIRESK